MPRAGAALVRNQTELRVTASPRILDIASLGNNAMPKLFDHVGETLGASFVETDVEKADLNRAPHCPAGRKARTPSVRHIFWKQRQRQKTGSLSPARCQCRFPLMCRCAARIIAIRAIIGSFRPKAIHLADDGGCTGRAQWIDLAFELF